MPIVLYYVTFREHARPKNEKARSNRSLIQEAVFLNF